MEENYVNEEEIQFLLFDGNVSEAGDLVDDITVDELDEDTIFHHLLGDQEQTLIRSPSVDAVLRENSQPGPSYAGKDILLNNEERPTREKSPPVSVSGIESEDPGLGSRPTCPTENQAFERYLLENELTQKTNICWKRGTFLSPDIQWYSPPQKDVDELPTPVQYFSRYFTDDFFELIVEKTNLYGIYHNPNFSITNYQEIKQLVGIMVMMGNLGYPRLRLYWDPMFRIPLIADHMQINRFLKLRQNIHVTDIEAPQNGINDKLWKVRPIYDVVRSRCLELPLETDLCIDEQMVPFKGHFHIKQYVKNKPSPWGIKIFVLCGKSGTMYDFIIHQPGTMEIYDMYSKFGLGASVVMHLSQRITVPNCKLYFDNFFTTFNLLEWLHSRDIFAVGTARENRFSKPPLRTDKEMKKEPRGNQDQVFDENGRVILTKWFDNKPVLCASNFVSAGKTDMCKRWDRKEKKFVEIPRPEAIQLYNQGMGGVDKLDFLITIYRTFILAKKWTLRMIDHSIDLAVTNSWLEYVKDATVLGVPKSQRLDLIHFRQHVSEALIRCNSVRGKKRGRPVSTPPETPPPSQPRTNAEKRPILDVRRDKLDHMPEFDDNRDGKRCKNENCNKKTHFFCGKCKVHLCITRNKNCFKEFHL